MLSALGQLALVTIPASGVFAPADEDELYRAIDDIGREHLALRTLRETVKSALGTVTQFNDRDAIETAYNDYRTESERAYFYAGLVFGVTLGAFGESSWR